MIDLLLIGAAVITVDADDRVISPGAVAVHQGRIVDVGSPQELRARHDAVETVDRPGAVILPGWVNTHAHLAMNLFRGLTDDVSLETFLDILVTAEMRILDHETVAVGVRAAVAEAVLGGCTTALDMYWFPRAAREVARETGFRLFNGPTFLGETDVEGRDFEGILREAADQLRQARQEDPDAPLWVMPHSSYTLSHTQLERIVALAAEFGARINTHASESTGELAAVASRHGARPVAVLDRAGVLGPTTVIAHGVHLTDDEMHVLADRGTAVAHCPVSNLKLGCGFSPAAALRAAGVTVGVGTDGAASGGALSMVENVRLAALLAKAVAQDPVALTARDVVRMGTADGAAALGLTDVGRIEPGTSADLQVVDVSGPHSTPGDPYSALVYASTAGDVTDVFIRGRAVLRDRRLTTMDEVAVMADLRAAAARCARLIGAPGAADGS